MWVVRCWIAIGGGPMLWGWGWEPLYTTHYTCDSPYWPYPPLQGVEEDDIGTQPGAQVAGMVDVGSTVLHHHAAGSKVTGMPPRPPPKQPKLG